MVSCAFIDSITPMAVGRTLLRMDEQDCEGSISSDLLLQREYPSQDGAVLNLWIVPQTFPPSYDT
jgi:hypothetical protein